MACSVGQNRESILTAEATFLQGSGFLYKSLGFMHLLVQLLLQEELRVAIDTSLHVYGYDASVDSVFGQENIPWYGILPLLHNERNDVIRHDLELTLFRRHQLPSLSVPSK